MSVMEIFRGNGDRPGPEITDPLLTHETAIEARGTHELDASTSAVEVSGDGFYNGTMPVPGTLVALVTDKGARRIGMIDDVELVLTRSDLETFTADCNIRIEAER